MRFDVSLGGYGTVGSSAPGLIDLGSTVLVRRNRIEFGAVADYGATPLAPDQRFAVGGLAGIGGYGRGKLTGFDLLAEGGVHFYDNIGGCFPGFSEAPGNSCWGATSPGVSGSAPYVGVRLGGSILPDSPEATRGFLGAWLYANWELTSTSITSFDGQLNAKVTRHLGGGEAGLTFRFGLDKS